MSWQPSEAYARDFGAANAVNQVASMAGRSLSFDANGNLTAHDGWTYEWTFGNRLIRARRAATVTEFAYDSDDRRTVVIADGVMTRTLWSGADEIGEYDTSGTLIRRFIPDGTGAPDARLATLKADGTIYWHHTDHQGSVFATSNSAGNPVSIVNYSPNGEPGTDVNGNPLAGPPLGSPFGYTGRQYDPGTGLYYYRARYYHPALGQFLSTDPIGSKDDPNLYLYVANDPVNGTDPTGMFQQGRQATTPGGCTRQTCDEYQVIINDNVVGTIAVPRIGFDDLGPVGLVIGAGVTLGQALWNEATDNSQSPELPEELVGGRDDPRAGPRGNRENSGPLTPENGGTGDADADFDHLTGGRNGPADPGSRYPEGTRVGENGIAHRPGTDRSGPRIDIPARGRRPHETLHY
jgi:RHS repeat-associated protein